MTHDERWQSRFYEVKAFIEANHRNPSKYDPEERGAYCNWIKHNRKAMNAGKVNPERKKMFGSLLELMKRYKRKNQYSR